MSSPGECYSPSRRSQHPAMRRTKAISNLRTMPYDRPAAKMLPTLQRTISGEVLEPVEMRRTLSSEARGQASGPPTGYDVPSLAELRGIPMERSGLSDLVDDLSFFAPVATASGSGCSEDSANSSTVVSGPPTPASGPPTPAAGGTEHEDAGGAAASAPAAGPPLTPVPPRQRTCSTKEQALVEAVLGSLAVGVEASRGPCDFMEDACAVRHEGDGLALVGVFDGHGGDGAAKRLRTSLPAHVAGSKHLRHDCSDASARRALLEAFGRCEGEAMGERCASGATAAVVLLQSGGRCLNVAWLGDCRVVLCRGARAITLTADHRPASDLEASRVRREGGTIVPTADGGRLGGCLAVTRAIGDYDESEGRKPAGLSATPELKSEPLTAEDEFVLLGSDGLFDVLPPDDAVRLARADLRAYGDASMCAEKLVNAALSRHADDNVTAMVLTLFPPKDDAEAEHARLGGACRDMGSFVRLPTNDRFVRVVGGF